MPAGRGEVCQSRLLRNIPRGSIWAWISYGFDQVVVATDRTSIMIDQPWRQAFFVENMAAVRVVGFANTVVILKRG